MSAAPLVVGMDARPALFGRTGFGRVVRETLAALSARSDLRLVPYGAAWRRARPDCAVPGVVAPRLPARLQRLAAPFGFGVETLLGPLDVFHHTDLVFAPVRRAAEVLTLYDLTFLEDPSWHGRGFASRVLPRLAARAAAAAAVVVPHPQVAEAVLRHGLVDAARLSVAPLGCDHVDPGPRPDDGARVAALRKAAGLPAEGLLVLSLGTREPRKNQLALLEAFLDAGPPAGASLLLAGPRGWCAERLEARLSAFAAARAAGRAAPSVAAAGEVGEEDLGALLRSADVVAYPSLAEGFGLPVAEALRCGRATLTSRGTPMADLGGEAVELVDPRDPADIARGLRALLEDPARRAARAAAGPARVAPLTWAAHTATLASVYRSVVSWKAPRSPAPAPRAS